MTFKDDITHQPLVVSNATTQVLREALHFAHWEGRISDEAYRMAYAETCELGRSPQALGGRMVDLDDMRRWQEKKSWQD